MDMIPHFYQAQKFITSGILPERGNLSTLCSFMPPGFAWLLLPGFFLFSDPRFFEWPASAFLYFGTLLGIFKLTDKFFGKHCAYLAVALYAFSKIGMENSTCLTLEPLAFFFIWMVYFSNLWIERRQTKYLAISMLIWSISMYIHMRMAPAFLILPALYLIYRPPLRLRPLIVAMVIIFLIWHPYLRFEFRRNFEDIKSQIFLKEMLPENFKSSWRNPNLEIRSWYDPSLTLETRVEKRRLDGRQKNLGDFLGDRYRLLLNNFFWQASGILAVLLFLICLSGLLLSNPVFLSRLIGIFVKNKCANSLLNLSGGGLIFLGLIFNEFFLSRYLSPDHSLEFSSLLQIRFWQLLLIISGGTILVLNKIFLKRCTSKIDYIERIRATLDFKDSWPLVLGLAIPGLLLFVLTPPNRGDRFFFIWPLQVIFLCAFLTNVLPRLKLPRLALFLIIALVVSPIVINPYLSSAVNSWKRLIQQKEPKVDIVAALEYIALQLHSEGRRHTSIGYRTFFSPFMVTFNINGSEYRAGAECDLILEYKYGISNNNRCAEGITLADEFRIVQTRPVPGHKTRFWYIDIDPYTNYKIIKTFGLYQVLKRNLPSPA